MIRATTAMHAATPWVILRDIRTPFGAAPKVSDVGSENAAGSSGRRSYLRDNGRNPGAPFTRTAPPSSTSRPTRIPRSSDRRPRASESRIRSPVGDPGHNSVTTSLPALRATYPKTAATSSASSSCPSTGMKSGIRSIGLASYGSANANAIFARSGTRESRSNRLNSTTQSGTKAAISLARARRVRLRRRAARERARRFGWR